jgi:hypothetical protein
MISPDSRYASIQIDTVILENGSTRTCLKRRFLPPIPVEPGEIVRPEQGDRIDQLSARILGDPLQFWRIADVNDSLNPFDLVVEVGRPFRLPRLGF